MERKKSSHRPTLYTQALGEETFQGLNINSDGKQPTIRHKDPSVNTTIKERKAIKRATEQRKLHDMFRQNEQMVKAAIRNKSESFFGS